MTEKRSRRIAAVVVSAVMVIGTTACSNPIRDLQERAVESGMEKLIESASGIDSVDLFSADVPADFPREVPLPDADLVTSFQVTEDGVTGWALHYNAEGADAFERYGTELTSAGFDETESAAMGAEFKIGIYEKEPYIVSVSHMNDGSTGMLQVTVTRGQS